MELEAVLITAEVRTKEKEIEMLEHRKKDLANQSKTVEDQLKNTQESQEKQQEDCKKRLDDAQTQMHTVEKNLSKATKGSAKYNELFEEFLAAQEALDNERKTFEDLEFHYLENEANALATREEIQREIIDISKKIDNLQQEFESLELDLSQSIGEHNAKMNEFEKQEIVRNIEKLQAQVQELDEQLSTLSAQDSEPELSSDSSDGEKKDPLAHLTSMSCSVMDYGGMRMQENNVMTQSFNEKLVEESAVLGKK